MATDPEAENANLAMFAEETLTPEAAATQRNQKLFAQWMLAYSDELLNSPPIDSCDSEKVGPQRAEENSHKYAIKDVRRAVLAAKNCGLVVLTVDEINTLMGILLIRSQRLTDEEKMFMRRIEALITEAATAHRNVQPVARAPP